MEYFEDWNCIADGIYRYEVAPCIFAEIIVLFHEHDTPVTSSWAVARLINNYTGDTTIISELKPFNECFEEVLKAWKT